MPKKVKKINLNMNSKKITNNNNNKKIKKSKMFILKRVHNP